MEYLRTAAAVMMVLGGAVVTALPCHAEVLVYKGENKWVAPEDNKPLLSVLKKASVKKTFKVKLPTDNRALGIARLEVVTGLLARQAGTGVIVEEVGVAKPGTIEIE